MKLLFDQNLSFKLCDQLADLFPDSTQIRKLNLESSDDRLIWEFAKTNVFTIVSHDSDFADMASFYGPPPKIIWLRCGNQTTQFIEQLFRGHAEAINSFDVATDVACYELY